MNFNIGLIIPTCNAGAEWDKVIDSIKLQTLKPNKVLIIDSDSTDNTRAISESAGFDTVSISQEEFNHGKTRQQGVKHLLNVDVIIFLTQDAILSNQQSLQNIMNAFNDPKVGAAYGRQLPRRDSSLMESHARLFNYTEQSTVKSMKDVPTLHIKTVFISNSFAAYRRETLIAIGGFPENTILGEDTYVAAKMLLADWKIAYCADAQVYHSHNYSALQEFKRYFDTGVFHSQEDWIRRKFGEAEGEGIKFVLSEIRYLIANNKWYLIWESFMRTLLKYIGYRLGMAERRIPVKIKRYLSMHSSFWNLRS